MSSVAQVTSTDPPTVRMKATGRPLRSAWFQDFATVADRRVCPRQCEQTQLGQAILLHVGQNQKRNGHRAGEGPAAHDGGHVAPCRGSRGWKSARDIVPIPLIAVRLQVKIEDTRPAVVVVRAGFCQI